MPCIFICTTGDKAGQSLMTWAICRKLSAKGLNVGLFKPFGSQLIFKDDHWIDQDVVLLKEVMGLKESLEMLNPYPTYEEEWQQHNTEVILKNIKSLAVERASKKDILIIIGSKHIFLDNSAPPIPDITLINELDGECILLNRYRKSSTSIYSLLTICSLLKDKMKGIIINRVPEDDLKRVRDKAGSDLIKKGIPITSILHEDPCLSFLTLEEIKQLLDGKIVHKQENLCLPVEGITVGSTYLKGDLGIFKRVYNKIILLKSLSPFSRDKESPDYNNIACIILTGGVKPAPQVLSAAEQAKIPIMEIGKDTFSALECLEKGASTLSPKEDYKVNRFTELLDQDGAFERLLGSLRVKN